ncbi:hypothetical protein [Phenylobacterium sp. Root700]|uniref:hypothetical protein n=1 Tax=Phenylobacterium sp. Root700 TaxID=1736591 RepID=UPI0012E3D07E|nr:hypothetical protein [Phenylobacterium sp. Root700]
MAIQGTTTSLHDFGEGGAITMRAPSGSKITGHDFGSGSAFTATVKGNRVTLYDYGDGQYHEFQVR